MQFQYTPYVLPLIAAAVISGWIVFYAWQRRSTPGATALAFLSLAISEWLVGYILEIAGVGLQTKLFWGKIQFIGIAFIPLLWLIFALYFSGEGKRLPHLGHSILAAVPLATIIVVFTTETHGLFWKEVHLDTAGSLSVLGVTRGLWFWVHSAYSYLLLLAGTIVILRRAIYMRGLYRRQAIALLVAVMTPWVGNFLYLSGLNPVPPLDLTNFAFTLSITAIAWGIFGFRLIDLLPIAREMVIEEMTDGMIVLDADGHIADMNPSAQRMIGLPASQPLHQPAAEVLRSWPRLTEKSQDNLEAVDEIPFGEGENLRWVELSLSPLYNRRKRFIGRVITMRDITRRKQAEERSEQLYRAVEASPASIVITDTRGNIQYINPKFTQVTGYTFSEALGKNPRILRTDQTPAEVHRQLWETITAGHEWRGEFCNRKKNGELYWESASISPITDSDGKITHFVAVKEDITEQRQVLEQLQKQQEALALARDQALEASHLKSQLLAKVSHELRTPLSAILGYAELLRSDAYGVLSEEQKGAMANIVESTLYLNTMINELLDQAQIEARKLTLRLDCCSLREILQRVEASMGILARKEGLALTTCMAPDLPDPIYGDEHRLQQILTNLVGNAIKYTRSGEVRVELFLLDPAYWAMKVSDTGVGIPKEAQPFIFEPFRQVDRSITHQNRGTGLGLSITKQLVDLMGGKISLESEVGSGSTFTVVLPVVPIPPDGCGQNLSR